ncbi:PBECR4 domain-containing protein [Streptococcus suis]
MVEEHTNQPSSRGKSRRERVEHARSRDILDVANELHMELVRSGRDYRWKEHDSMVISPDKNMWNWFSRHQGGDVIALVQTMKEINFNQAIDYLNDGAFKEFITVERVQESFNYYLKPYEQPFEEARNYLKEQRGLSDETIDFFLEKGVIAQANAKVNGSIEPVVVFKSFDFSGEIVGATLQGIEENWEKWHERGYAKNIVRNSDGITGMHVDIGQPNRLIFAESAIDLMSYYELNKANLQDVRLISMDGLKEGVIGRHLAQLQSELSGRPLRWNHDELAEGLQTAIDNNFFMDGKHADWITLAVDNDEAGRNFISSLREKGAVVTEALPDLQHGQEKMDWNDALKSSLSDQISKIDQLEIVEDYQNQVYELIADITQDDTAYYLWHDEELHNLGGGDSILEEFHGMLEDRKYPVAGAELYVEESINDGATGYLSLEGHVLDRDGILDYLSDQEFSDLEKVEFLTKLQNNLPEIWDKVLNHYEDTFKVVVNKYELKSSDSPLIQNQDTESLASEQKTVTYDFVKQENEDLVKQLEARIKAGEISISFDTDLYFYDVFGNLGNSHPLKYINAKRLEVLAPLQPILASIDDKTVDLYKNKGTVEQDSLYQALKPHQRTLGVDISTRFIGELAIAAYSTNKQLESLSAEQFGAYYGTRTFDNLSQSIERMLEYPLNEAGIKDYTYGFVTTPNAFYHYLVEQEGKVVLSRSDVEMLMSRIESQSYQIVEPIQEEVAVSEVKENPLDSRQEVASNSEQNKKERTSQYKGSLQPEAEGSTAPVSETDTFDRSVTSRPTKSSHYLEFTINGGFKSRKTRLDTSVDKEQLAKINRFADTIQSAARFYQEELANSKINYFTSSGDVIQVNFLEKNFVHLTGLKFIGDNQTPEKTLRDLAAGGTHSFDDIRISNTESAFSKVKVLPELKAALQTDSFYFDNLQNIPRYTDKFHSLIKSSDQDLMLLFRDTEESGTVPVSVFKSRAILEEELLDATKNEILGIYRDRDGVIEQIDINEKYISDGGQEMLSILENKQYEEALVPTQEIVNNDEISAELFTQVLDAAYNVGDPRKLGTQVPEESKVAWERYYELSDKHEGNFGVVVDVADQMGLIDKDSNFYREWNQNRIYNENYHVRLQWSEDWEERGPQLPFNATDLIDYGAFAEELYSQNNSWRSRHVESIQEGSNVYIPYTKVKFDVYAPGGTLIKDNVGYDIGDETEPISRLLGLGYRRLEGQPGLAAIDEKILSQLENQEVNQGIATEANEQYMKTPEALPDEDSRSRRNFQSDNQDMKAGLAQKVEEIMAEESVENPVKEDVQEHIVTPEEPFDYTSASAYEISEHAFQKIREYTQSPEDLLEYMDFMSKFPQLSPRNVALIHEQWRGANAVATYDQWQAMGEVLGVKPEDVIQTKATYTNKRTGETKEVVHQGLSVKTGEKSQITLFRPLMVKMIPVLDENGHQVKNDKGNPKFKKLSEATSQEKALVKDGQIPVRQFQERDPKTGYPRFTTYKVFELSQTTLKPESYPKAMPNRHYNFNVDKVKTKEVLEGLCDYAEKIGVAMMKDEAHVLGNAKGAFYPEEQLILINPDNTPGEKIATTIHELAHATLHNPKLVDQYKELPKGQKELEAEMTSHILSKHFGLDTSEKAINYMASWTGNLKALDDQQLADSLKRVHKTVSNMMKHVENHTKPYSLGKKRGQAPNFPKPPTKGPIR